MTTWEQPWLLLFVAKYSERVAPVVIMNAVFHSDFQRHSWAQIWQNYRGLSNLLTRNKQVCAQSTSRTGRRIPQSYPLDDAIYSTPPCLRQTRRAGT